MFRKTPAHIWILLSLALLMSAPLFAAKPDKTGNGKPAPGSAIPVVVDIDTLHLLNGDAAGPYEEEGSFFDDNLIFDLSSSARMATVDLNYPADGGPALGVTTNNSLQMNIRGQIAQMFVGEHREVDGLFSFTHATNGKKYRINFSGGNGTSLVSVTRISESEWLVEAPQGSLARLWDITRHNKAVLIGLYSMDFRLVITVP